MNRACKILWRTYCRFIIYFIDLTSQLNKRRLNKQYNLLFNKQQVKFYHTMHCSCIGQVRSGYLRSDHVCLRKISISPLRGQDKGVDLYLWLCGFIGQRSPRLDSLFVTLLFKKNVDARCGCKTITHLVNKRKVQTCSNIPL